MSALFQFPSAHDLAFDAIVVFLRVAIDTVFVSLLFGLRVDLAFRVSNTLAPVWPFALYLVAFDCVKPPPLRALMFFLFLAWTIYGRHYPWRKLRRRAAAKLSSLTEVARAAFNRQAAEAAS